MKGIKITRRGAVIFLAVIILTGTLLYVEHPSVRALKSIASVIGIIDSEHTIVGMIDVRSSDHIRGNEKSDVVLVEYSDLSCVMCAAMQESFKKIADEENILLVSRHLYPYTEGYAFEWAVAAECVAKYVNEDAFFTFAQYVYENQHTIDDETGRLAEKAEELGTTKEQFRECIAGDIKIRKHIQRDSEEGWRLGARGTPYIVVVYKNKPIGISYANEYSKFLERVRMLIERERL